LISLTQGFLADVLRLQPSERSKTFEALAKLSSEPRLPGLRTRKLQGSPFYEVRVSQELRIVADLIGDSFLCQIIDHHDAAFRRAARLSLGTPNTLSKIKDLKSASERYESSTSMNHFGGFSDEQLFSLFGVPEDWTFAVRSFATEEGVLDSGIDHTIGLDNTIKLAETFKFPGRQTPSSVESVTLVRGSAMREVVERLSRDIPIEQLIIVIPHFLPWSGSPSFAFFVETIRTRKVRTLLITKSPENPDQRYVVNMLSGLPVCEVLTNDAVHSEVVACLAPSPNAFGILGAGGIPGGEESFAVLLEGARGHESAIKCLANVGLLDLRTQLQTRVYVAA
jgi:hypothetical protein